MSTAPLNAHEPSKSSMENGELKRAGGGMVRTITFCGSPPAAL